MGDVNSREDWLKALDDVDYVIHLAAETGTGQSMYEIKKYVDTNIGGTALLLDILTSTKHHDLFFGTGAGTLIEPSKLYKDVTDIELATKLTPIADDIWINAIVRLSGMQWRGLNVWGIVYADSIRES